MPFLFKSTAQHKVFDGGWQKLFRYVFSARSPTSATPSGRHMLDGSVSRSFYTPKADQQQRRQRASRFVRHRHPMFVDMAHELGATASRWATISLQRPANLASSTASEKQYAELRVRPHYPPPSSTPHRPPTFPNCWCSLQRFHSPSNET